MPDFTMKANDRLPSIAATLGFEGGAAVDLTGASVQFILRPKAGTTPKVKAPAVIVAAATGAVRYDWAAVDTNTPGEYLAEWEVTFANGKPQTFPTASYHEVAILADLDAEG